MENMMRGIYPVLVTPFTENNEIDVADLCKQVEFAIEAGAHGLVPTVNAGECSLLDDDERQLVVETVIKQTNKRVPVVVGIAAKADEQAVKYAVHAQSAGADAIMSMPPYVAKCSPPQAVEYYKMIDAAIDIPFFIQNFFAPLGTPLPAAMLYNVIRDCKTAQYMKEESGCPSQLITELLKLLEKNPIDHFKGIFGGLGGSMMIHETFRGACGCMPAPHLTDVFVDVWELLESGKNEEAISLHNKLLPAITFDGAYGVSGWKAILKYRGVISNDKARRGGGVRFDERNYVELDQCMSRLAPLMRVKGGNVH